MAGRVWGAAWSLATLPCRAAYSVVGYGRREDKDVRRATLEASGMERMEEVRERSAVTVADGWRAPSPPAVATASAAPVGGDRWVREGSEPREASMWSNELVGNGGRNMEALARMSSGVMPAWDTQWAPGARPMSPYAPGATTGGDKPPAPSETPTAPAGAASSAAYPATPSPADMAALRAMMRRVYIILYVFILSTGALVIFFFQEEGPLTVEHRILLCVVLPMFILCFAMLHSFGETFPANLVMLVLLSSCSWFAVGFLCAYYVRKGT